MAAIATPIIGGLALANQVHQGNKAESAAKSAARTQAAAADRSAAMTQQAQEQLRADLAPFRDVGLTALPLLEQMAVSGPTSMADRVQALESNPLFQAALNSRNRATLGAAATQGRIGTGDFSRQLSEDFLLAASPLIQQQMEEERLQEQRLLNLVNIAQPSAAQVGASGVNAARAAGLDFQSAADARSAGQVAAQQISAGTTQNVLDNLPSLITAIQGVRQNG